MDKLLSDVKVTVEGLLCMPTANVWSIYGGLKRLSVCVEKILNHGLKYSQEPGVESTLDYNQFIRRVQVVSPVLAPPADKIRKMSAEDRISEGQAWVRYSLQSHTMLAQLRVLVGDRQHLTNCYSDEAFLCNEEYFEAFAICLEAVQKNKPSLLSNIDHSLLMNPGKKRSATLSFPLITESKHTAERTGAPFTDPLTRASMNNYMERTTLPVERQNSRKETDSNGYSEKGFVRQTSQPNVKPSKGKQPMKGHQRSKSEMSAFKSQQQALKMADSVDGSVLSTSLPDKESEMVQRRRGNRLEGGMLYSNDSYFPQPSPGESLKSYLSSQDFDTCAELDRENAHFAISEALMSAIEHMKWNQVLRPAVPPSHPPLAAEESEGESDEEIVRLKKKIEERRKLRSTKKLLQLSYSERSSSGATPKSSSRSNSARDSDSVHSDEESLDNLGFSDTDSMLTLRDGFTLSRRLSEREASNIVPSADQVALSLLSHFNEYHMPKADELVWLVSEKEAPQALLPLPNSLSMSPDDLAEGRKGTRIRGNAEWAPPRPQIIFNVHPSQGRKALISKQNYRCAGCGNKIEQGYLKRFRYCEYLGKYFCHCCHTNETSVIPGRILHKWDFSKYPVSNFSRDLLSKIESDPLFNLLDIDKGLLQRVRTLQRITLSRLQLRFSKPFLASCRLATEFYQQLTALPEYLLDDVHLYSINDLLKAKSKEMDKSLQATAKALMGHILSCELCKAKGFICEICGNEKDIIFPFQFNRVIRCNRCLSCFHTSCYTKLNRECPKCVRLEARKKSFAENSSISVENTQP